MLNLTPRVVCLTGEKLPGAARGRDAAAPSGPAGRGARTSLDVSVTVKAGTCIGCGTCAAACASDAITCEWTRRGEFVPSIAGDRCRACGRCLEVCPQSPATLSAEAERICHAPQPSRVGLEGVTCYVAWDRSRDARLRSASGGVVTAVLRRLFEAGRIDTVLHAEPVSAPMGAPHVRAAVSRSPADLETRRSSFYHPVCHADTLKALCGSAQRVAVVGTPCVIRAVRSLWALDPRFVRMPLLTVGLACSHNVTGRYIDFLGRSLGIGPGVPFSANLRNKADIPDANNYNTSLSVDGREVVRMNRFRSLHTHMWRGHWFVPAACHACADFWAPDADVTVKDAWGAWAKDPLGKSLLVVRRADLTELLAATDWLHLEPIATEAVASSQDATVVYKQEHAIDRLRQPAWSRANRASGYTRFRIASMLSSASFARLGYGLTRILMLAVSGRPVRTPPGVDPAADANQLRAERRLAAQLDRALRREHRRRVVCWGTGAMGAEVGRALLGRIDYFVDGSPERTAGHFHGRPVFAPSALECESADDLLILVASLHDEAIRERIESLALTGSPAIVSVAPIRTWARARPWYRRPPRRVAAPRKPARRPALTRERKILVVGGYGYQNAGDEAQLSATLAELRSRFPTHVVKVLTPNPSRTHVDHDRCVVGEAPRLAFYDSDRSPLYDLSSRWRKFRFLARASWLLLQAGLVRRGMPTALVGARRAALLYDLATADLLYFSGGGYLTGKTLSRLWDGSFLLLMARMMGTPSVLAGQTLGLWNSRLTRALARRAFAGASVIATRDNDGSRDAVRDLGLFGPRVMTTCDDALLMPREDWRAIATDALASSGFAPDVVNGPYVVLNAHYWGVNGEDERAALVARLAEALDTLRHLGVPAVVGLPMVPEDAATLTDLERARPDGWFRMLRYDGHFRVARAVIATSRLCVSMKHHPLIFAMGEGVPAISLSRGPYYEQKNIGALGLVGLQDCNVPIDREDFAARFLTAAGRAEAEHESISQQVKHSLGELAARRDAFFDMVERLVPAPRAGRRAVS
jgi:coenzyme F420 hydrogenase subunit beta